MWRSEGEGHGGEGCGERRALWRTEDARLMGERRSEDGGRRRGMMRMANVENVERDGEPAPGG